MTYVGTNHDPDDAGYDPSKITLNTTYPSTTGPETVVVKIKDSTQPALQTIRYELIGDALARTVNGVTQLLARNVSDVNFTYEYTDAGNVERVVIVLEGQTADMQSVDAIAGQKTRVLSSSVALRNAL